MVLATVIWRSSMASSRAACTLAGAPVDLVGEDDVGEDGTRLKLKPVLGVLTEVRLGTRDVGRQQVRRELDLAEVGLEVPGQALYRPRLGQTGKAFDQHIAITEQSQQ